MSTPKHHTHQDFLDMVYDLLNQSPLKPAVRERMAQLETARHLTRDDKAFILRFFNMYQPKQPE